MSHPKDEIDETQAGDSGMTLVDLLYGDLSDDEREQAAASLKNQEPDLEADLEAFTSLRSLFRALPDEEPPAGITAKLMHAAALHAPKQASATEEATGKTGLLAFLAGLFRPIAMHPGLAAAASMVLIVLVGGTIYMNGKSDGLGEPEVVDSLAPDRPAVMPEGTATGALEGLEEGGLADEAADTTADPAQGEAMATEQTGEDAEFAANADPAEKMLLQGDELDGKFDQSSIAGGAILDDGVADKRSNAGKRSRRSASKSSSARTGAYYEGEELSTDGYRSGARGVGTASSTGATGGAPVIAQTKTRSAPVATPAAEPEVGRSKDAKPRPRTAEVEAAEDRGDVARNAPGNASMDDDDGAPEAAPQAPPPPAKKPAQKNESQETRPSKKKAQEPARDQSDVAARVRSLHSEARIAASRGDCKTVAEAGREIRSLDATYYKKQFLKDRAFAKCTAQKAL